MRACADFDILGLRAFRTTCADSVVADLPHGKASLGNPNVYNSTSLFRSPSQFPSSALYRTGLVIWCWFWTRHQA